MSIFSSIMNKIFHHGSSSPTSAGGSGEQVASAAAPSTASTGTGAGGQTVDVEVVLSGMEKNAGQKLDWRHSIVDLMKLFNLDSGLSTRKELAQELGYTGDMNDSASMNGLKAGHAQAGREWRQGSGLAADLSRGGSDGTSR